MNWNTKETTEGVSDFKFLTHGLHIVTLKEVVKADWSGGNALDAFFVDDKGLEYKHRIFEFKGKEDLKNFKGELVSVDAQWTTYLSYIKHIFNKCFKHAEAGKFDQAMAKVTSFDTLISVLDSLKATKVKFQIKLVDDGKGYAKFPKYIKNGFCDFVDNPQYNLTFDEAKEGKKEKPASVEKSTDFNVDEMPWLKSE